MDADSVALMMLNVMRLSILILQRNVKFGEARVSREKVNLKFGCRLDTSLPELVQQGGNLRWTT